MPAGEQGTISSTNPSRAVKFSELAFSATAGGGWAEMGGVEVPLCPLLEPLVPHPERLAWGQPSFRGGLSPEGDSGL